MKQKIAIGLVFYFMMNITVGQKALGQEYITNDGKTFTIDKILPYSPVKDQGNSGTCWDYATISFLESELLREGKDTFDFSEMYISRLAYLAKAERYIRLGGKAQFSQGGQAHDVINLIKTDGILPQNAYIGSAKGELIPDHSDLENELKNFVSDQVHQQHPSLDWKLEFNIILNETFGNLPSSFNYDGKQMTPKEFSASLGLNWNDYVEFTSYSHHPFKTWFDLEIPDNWSHDLYFNVPINDLVSIADSCIAKGYTITWDGDVSEKYFTHAKGYAILDDETKTPTDSDRQITFDTFTTTDDHLMHLVGIAHDQNGKKYYIIKNSWGETGRFQGLLFMSENYFRLKTVAILVNKNAISIDFK